MEALNIQLSPFFQWLLKTSLQGSLLICLILLVKSVLRGKLPIRWHYYLWLLLLVRLAMPWVPQSRISIFNLVPQYPSPEYAETAFTTGSTGDAEAHTTANSETTKDTAEHTVVEQETVQPKPATLEPKLTSTSAPVVLEAVSPDRSDSTRPVSVGVVRILPLAWLVGAIALGGYVAVRNFNLWRTIKRERPVTDQEILDLLEDCKMQMNVQTIVGVVVTDRVKSPALFGFVRPRLLLPQGLIEALDLEELHYVFLHELAHLKRRDIYLGWLVSLLQVMHWFNPLIWFALRRMRTDQELACDGLALSTMNTDEPPKYGRTIVNLFERFSQVSYMPSIASILEDKSQLERRIKMIAKFKNNTYQRSPLAVILIIILACVSLPDAKRMKASEASTPESSPRITLRQVWSGPDVDPHVAASPDGRYLSYVDWKTGDLAIREIATGKTRHLTSKGNLETARLFALYSVISPDSRLVAYSWFNEHGTSSLCLVGIDGSADRTLYTSEDHGAFPVCWSSDSKQVAVKRRKGGNLEIILVSVEQGSIKVLKTCEKPPFWDEFCYSPDDRFIVYDFPTADNSSTYDIGLFDTKDNSETSLIEHPANDRLLGWLPNRDEILFLSDRTGSQDIWAMKIVDGKAIGSPRPVTRDIGQITPQGLTHDGSFYFSRYTRRFTIYTVSFDTETGEVQAESKTPLLGSNSYPEWSPDGESLAYITEKEDKMRLHIRSLRTGEERELAGDIGVRSPRWSPDGRFILAPGFDNSKRDQKDYRGGLYTIDVEKNQATQLVQFPPRQNGWAGSTAEWSLDGKAVFYLTPSGIVKRDLDSGQEKQLYQCDSLSRALSLSPDGKRLAFSTEVRSEGKASIVTVPVSGGEPRELCEFVEPKGGMQVPRAVVWAPDGNYVLFAKDSTIWRVASQGGVPQMILESSDVVHSLGVHPHGEEVAYSTYIQEGAVWVMENFLPGTPVAKPEPTTTVRRVGYEWRGPFANLSPDGKYMSDRDWDTGTLVVRELATGKSRTLVDKGSHEAGYPLVSAISPDSKEIAYLWHDPNTKASGLHVIGLDGSGHRVLCKGKWPMPMNWSADGQKILATVLENDVAQMVWISASDGSIQHIVDVNLGYLGKVDISLDGRFIAYNRPQGEDTLKRDIFVFDLRENRELSVINHPADDKFLGWTPDGRHIFFASNRTGTWDAWLLPVANGKPQGFPKLAWHGIGNITPVGFTPQGSYYYGHEQTLRDVFVARLDLESGEFLSEPMPVRQSGATGCHDWSPDGLYLAYCTRRSDESQAIHIRTLATSRERTLSNNLPHIRWLRWSPDMRSFLIDGYKRGDSQGVISKIDVKTGKRTDLVRSQTEVLVRPEMSPDGKTLFYDRSSDPKSKTVCLIARDLENGREKELFQILSPARLTNSALSPDGRRFVLSIVPDPTRPVGPVLKILSVAGGEPRELIQFDKSEKLRAVGVTWTPDSRSVLFWKWWYQADKELELWRISAEGGEARRLCSRKTFGHIRVHPDGQRVAFSDRSTTRGLWVMENFLPEEIGK